MKYRHTNIKKQCIDLPSGKVVCVGRNYASHAKELNNPIPNEPILFIKPNTSLISFDNIIDISLINHSVHYELEISILINKELKNANATQVMNSIEGVGLSLDLTFRSLQNKLKEKGFPWEIAKAFDKSCPTSSFFTDIKKINLTNLDMTLSINNETRQKCNSSEMLVSIISLIEYASIHFTLLPGDIIITGTPSGVGALCSGDRIKAQLNDIIFVETVVI